MAIALPYWWVLNILFVLLWFLLNPNALLSIIALLCSYPQFKLHYQSGNVPNTDAVDLKVVSFNIRSFNKYNWLDEAHVDDKIMAFLKQDADAVATKFYYRKESTLPTI